MFFSPTILSGPPRTVKVSPRRVGVSESCRQSTRRLTIHSAVLILVGMIRWSRDGDDDGDGGAEGLRPAPDFHT